MWRSALVQGLHGEVLNLPSHVFTQALYVLGENGVSPEAPGYVALLRAECKRLGWVQKDEKDVSSWEPVSEAAREALSDPRARRPTERKNA